MKKIPVFLFLAIFSLPCFSQKFKVDYLHGNNYVSSITILNNNIWVGGYLGLTRINCQDYNDRELITDKFIDAGGPHLFGVNGASNSNGDLILAALGTIFQYDYLTKKLHKINTTIQCNSIFIDEFNTIWAIDRFSELVKIDATNHVTRYNSTNSCLNFSTTFNCIFVKNNIVWLGTDFGLIRFDGNVCEKINIPNTNIVKAIRIDQHDNIWLACHTWGVYPAYNENHSLVKRTGSNFTIYNQLNSQLPKTNIYNLELKGDTVYLCTSNGLITFDGNAWQSYTYQQNGLASNTIYTVAFEGSKTWIGTDSGLTVMSADTSITFKIAPATFTCYYQGPIVEDLTGNIYVATGGSSGNLSKFDGYSWKVLIQGSVNNPQSFYSLAVDSNNVVWATIYSSEGALYKIKNDTITRYGPDNSPIPDFPMDIAVDKYNNKWITSDLKLCKFDDINWTSYTSSDCQYLKFPRTIAADHKGNIWLGVYQIGMLKFDGTTWTYYGDDFFGYQYPEANKIIIDTADNVWIDFNDGGQIYSIVKFDGNVLTWYGANIGIPERFAGLLAVDKNGNLWYSDMDGLSKYDFHQWTYYNSSNTRILNGYSWYMFIDSHNFKWVSYDFYVGRFNEDSLYHGNDTLPPIKSDKHYLVYPNPTYNLVYLVSTTAVKEEIIIELYDVRGSLLTRLVNKTGGNSTLDLTKYRKELFFIKIIGGDFTEIHKVCKI